MTEYRSTDIVPQTSEYVCTACGETTEFEAGDDFSVCGSCGDEDANWMPAVEDESSRLTDEQTEGEFISE